ncbi:MAG: hypothetical protein ABL967_15610 [Bryobacteraceae bacterium]
MSALKRFILWDYPRASWQYDIIVAVILLFIFATPREIFQDQPRPASIAMVHGGYWIEPQQLAGVADADLALKATQVINQRYKIHADIANVEPIYDDAQAELKGYLAFPK